MAYETDSMLERQSPKEPGFGMPAGKYSTKTGVNQ